jgi:hypothetical protein
MPARQEGNVWCNLLGLFRDIRHLMSITRAMIDRPKSIFVPSCNIITGAIDIQKRKLSRFIAQQIAQRPAEPADDYCHGRPFWQRISLLQS